MSLETVSCNCELSFYIARTFKFWWEVSGLETYQAYTVTVDTLMYTHRVVSQGKNLSKKHLKNVKHKQKIKSNSNVAEKLHALQADLWTTQGPTGLVPIVLD